MRSLAVQQLGRRCARSPVSARILVLGVVLACGAPGATGAEEPSADVLTSTEREQCFQRYFDRMTAPKPLTRFHTKDQWLAYRSPLREKILRSIGLSPLPERVALSPKITGRLERDGYSIERVYYQVLPKVYASGYLYTPGRLSAGSSNTIPVSARLPAVLNPHGHWALGALDPTVQSRCIALAKKGYVAFCPDSTHVADFGVGLCPIGLMTWNNMRALDYLASLDFVDPQRLGCTGESGGGQQTMYLAALDDRVKVIVPAVLVSYFRRILFVSEETHCFCNHAPGIARLTDETEMAAMFAPRPTRFICATGDWTREFPKEEFPDIRHIFNLMEGNVDCVQFDKPHNYDRDSRESMYPWMNKYLKGIEDAAAAKEPPVAVEQPEVLRALSQPIPGASDLEGARAFYRSRYAFVPPRLRGKAAWQTYQKQLRGTLGELLGEDVPNVALNPISRGAAEVQGLKMEKLLLHTEPEVVVPAWLFLPEQRRGRRPALVIAHPEGKRALLNQREGLVRELLGRGMIVLAVDPRMRGELRRNWYWNEMIWGRPEEGMAAHDLNGAGTYLRSRADVNPGKIFVLGLGEAGRFALCAAALDAHWAGAGSDAIGPLYEESDPPHAVANLLRHGDLPQIASLVAPRRLWLNGATNRFAFTGDCYRAFARTRNLLCTDLAAAQFDLALGRWLTDELDTSTAIGTPSVADGPVR